jgi:hypothetical protein
MNTESIRELILQSEKNLCIAEAVAEAFPEARRKLAEGFLKRLEGCLKVKLKGWSFNRDNVFFDDDWPWFRFSKPAWKNQYGVALACGSYGKLMGFGIYREKDKIGKRPRCEEVLNAIKESYSTANRTPWFEAFVEMKTPAPNWRKPEVLYRMHKDKKFLNEVVEQLVDVVKISEPILDRLVRKKGRIAS